MPRGDVASNLGFFVRLVAPLLLALGGAGLISYGVWLIDSRIGYIVAGLFLLLFARPRPVGRK